MDEALAFIQQDDVFSAMASLIGHLAQVRANTTSSEWRRCNLGSGPIWSILDRHEKLPRTFGGELT